MRGEEMAAGAHSREIFVQASRNCPQVCADALLKTLAA